jgi:hypothetical protein
MLMNILYVIDSTGVGECQINFGSETYWFYNVL